jgi:hypothetical protein
MTLLTFYVLCAVTTGVVAVYELFWPVITQLRITHKELNIVRYWKIAVTTFFIMSVLVAPLLLPACIIPSRGERFRNTLAVNLENTN